MAASTAVAKRGSGRVTAPKPKTSKNYVDVDAILAEKGLTPRAASDIPTFTMGIFGEDFRVLHSINILSMIMADDDDPQATANSVRSIINMIHPDERKEFQAAYARQTELTGEMLNEIIAAMLRGASAPNPSPSSRGSGRTAKRTTSRKLSAAS